MMKKSNSIMIVSVLLLCARLGFAVDAKDLLRLSRLEGKDYIRERDKLVVEDTPLPVVSDAKLKLLSGILKARRSHADLFKSVNETIRRSRVLREKMTDEERANAISERGQRLGYDLSKGRVKHIFALNMAMAELLWKTAMDDYERISVVEVLSIHDDPIKGIFEITHDVLPKAENSILACELLVTMFRHGISYGKGDKQIVIRDIMLVSERFPKKLYIQERCLRLLKGVKAKDTQHLSGVISERIKAIEKEQREKIRRNKPVEKEVNITITGP